MGSAEAQQVQEGEVMDHACRYWQCVENYGGQCFGGGCRLNPAPEDAPEDAQASDTEDTDNG